MEHLKSRRAGAPPSRGCGKPKMLHTFAIACMICQIVVATAREEQFLNVFQRARSPARFGRSGMGPQRMGRGGMGRQWGHPMMMTDEANVGNAEIGNRLATEEFNTIARNWPALEF